MKVMFLFNIFHTWATFLSQTSFYFRYWKGEVNRWQNLWRPSYPGELEEY